MSTFVVKVALCISRYLYRRDHVMPKISQVAGFTTHCATVWGGRMVKEAVKLRYMRISMPVQCPHATDDLFHQSNAIADRHSRSRPSEAELKTGAHLR
jgi:hypothetical protein